jgi:hypothetical protein
MKISYGNEEIGFDTTLCDSKFFDCDLYDYNQDTASSRIILAHLVGTSVDVHVSTLMKNR